MASPPPVGITRLEALHYYVHDLERSRRFYTGFLDFGETGRSGKELERSGRQRSAVFEDGRQLEHEVSIRAYSLHELGRVLQQVGFKVLEVSGGAAVRGRFFGTESRQILLVAEKKLS